MALAETFIGDTLDTDTGTGSVARERIAGGILLPGQVLNDRYRVIKELGKGGMGAVYQAWDDELGVDVAIKVILPQAHDPAAAADITRRFKQELILARQITHKNVVRIHDIGEVGGIKFISMPCINGQDLATMLKKGALPLARALGLARQIAAGLAAAHDAGIVHRDLKPGNIMVEGGERALLMDFGIARSVRGPTTSQGTGPGTVVGTVVGTLGYMAPEQAEAQPVDGRADIYAFGLILLEMLTGPRRMTGDGAMRDLVARMKAAPPGPRAVDPAVPEPLDALVLKCLQPDREQRFQTSAELNAALGRLDAAGHLLPERGARPAGWKVAAAVLTLAATAAVATGLLVREPAGPPPPPEPVSVLIADFENRADDSVFSGALEDAMTLAIEEASFITTFPRATAESLNAQLRPGQPLDEQGARVVSQREGIKIVLAGAIEPAGGGYRLTVRAIDPIPGSVIATITENASGKGAVLTAVAGAAAKLREALGDAEIETTRLTADETFTAASLEAAQSYSHAQRLSQQAKYEEAIGYYKLALEQDPLFGRAYSGWALAASNLGRTEEAERLFKQALARIDRMTDREKYRTLGLYYSRIAREPEKAIESFAMLVERYPADSAALNNLALGYFNALNFPKALEYGARLIAVYPDSALYQYNYALYAMYASEFEAVAAPAERAIAINPDMPKAYLALAMTALAKERPDEAIRVWERAARFGPLGQSLAATGLADLALFRGQFAEALALLEPAIAQDREGRRAGAVALKLVEQAEALGALGRRREATAAVEEALTLGRSEAILVPAARLMIAAGRIPDALKLAEDLRSRLPARPRAYATVIDAEAALAQGKPAQAVAALQEGLKLADLWILRYMLGVSHVRAGSYAQAVAEFEACERRRGEATAVFLNDSPTWRYTAPLNDWLSRARAGAQPTP